MPRLRGFASIHQRKKPESDDRRNGPERNPGTGRDDLPQRCSLSSGDPGAKGGHPWMTALGSSVRCVSPVLLVFSELLLVARTFLDGFHHAVQVEAARLLARREFLESSEEFAHIGCSGTKHE